MFASLQVARAFNRSASTVHALLVKYRQTGSVEDLPRRPRSRITTPVQDRYITLTHLRNRRLNAAETARGTIGTHGRHISGQTVRNRLRVSGLRARRPYNGLILTPRHRRLRLAWARRHVRDTRADWGRVLFTDESRFNLRRSDGRARVYRRLGERYTDACVTQIDRFGGGSRMIWAGVSLHTKTPAITINGNLNAARYQNEIILPVVVPHLRANRGMSLLQDNAPAHSARGTLQMMERNRIRVLAIPPCSPDLNPIEHLWDHLDRQLRKGPQPANLRVLERELINIWENIPQRFVFNYINSMRQRCLDVIRAQGGHTRY